MGSRHASLQALDGPADQARALLKAWGFRDPQRALEAVQGLRGDPACGGPVRALDASLAASFRRAADPDLALERLRTLLEAAGANRLLTAWRADPECVDRFVRLAGASRFAGDQLLRWPEGIAAPGPPPGRDDLEGVEIELLEAIRQGGASTDGIVDRLRTVKKVQILRIAARDVLQGLPPREVAAELSRLADALIRAALELAAAGQARKLGLPEPIVEGFGVFAVGKLGGGELNYSSDVDLLFVHGTASHLTEIGPSIYYTRLAERLADILSRVTAEGILYRVDMRLRPRGRSGPLVPSREALLRYYESEAHVWERQALIRLRPAAGDLPLLRAVQAELDPLIYRKYLSLAEIREIQRLKGQLEREAMRRGPARKDVKFGLGGIRDVEFTVQFLQLLDGGRHPEVKGGNVFGVIEALEAIGALTPDEAEDLTEGYGFLRRVEHRIQLDRMLQTFQVPRDPAALRRLARGLGFAGPAPFLEALDRRSARIRQVHGALFGGLFAAAGEDGSDVDLILELPAEEERVREVLGRYRFRDAMAAYQRLRSLAGQGGRRGSPRARKFFANIAGRVLRYLTELPDPDEALGRFESCVATLGAPSVFFQLLSEDEKALHLFLDIAANARLVVDILRGAPGIFDEVVDALLTGQAFERFGLTESLRATLRAGGERTFHEFKRIQTVLIAIRDITGKDNLANTLANLTALADAIVLNLVPFVGREVAAKLGRLRGDRGTPTFAVLGLGKLGGEEMNYSSDLDLVCIYDRAGRTDAGLEAREYFIRYFQEVVSYLNRRDYLGPLYPVDLRLRPMGSHEAVVASFDRLRSYFGGSEAATWEKQAFTRLRPIAGDPALGRRIRDFFRRRVIGGLPREEVFPAVRAMRAKLEQAAPARSLKRGPGGLLDIEFIVQALQLVEGKAHPEILVPTTPKGLVRLGARGLLTPAQISELLTAYQFLRRLETHLSLFFPSGVDAIALDAPETEAIARRLGYAPAGPGGAAGILASELDYHGERTRRIFDEILGT